MLVAHRQLHMWEEPCISGKRGSGTIFFSGCTLRCVFCQNSDISRGDDDNGKLKGEQFTPDELSDIMFELKDKGAHNINLVTPDLYMNEVREAIITAKKKGLVIPVIFNISGYETAETIRRFEGLVDIYLTDFKYIDDDLAWKYSRGKNYTQVVKSALAEMMRQIQKAEFDNEGMMKKGVIVRHLMLPGHRKDAEKIIDYLTGTYHDNLWISLMSQYVPFNIPDEYPELNRRVTKREYEKLIDYALDHAGENVYIQEGDVAKESFIPKFT